MSNVLITGSEGFIGRQLISRLAGKHDIHFFSKSIGSDVCNSDQVRNAVKDMDYVFHLAGMSRVLECEKHPFESYNVNVKGTCNVMMACREHNAELIFASSWMADHPSTVYGCHKELAELCLNPYMDSICRLNAVYGEYERCHSILIRFIEFMKAGKPIPMFNNSHVIRDFIHVDDVTDALCRCRWHSGIFDIGTGKYTSLEKLLDIISETLNLDYEITEMNKSLPAEVDKPWLKTTPDWETKINLEDGILRCKDV